MSELSVICCQKDLVKGLADIYLGIEAHSRKCDIECGVTHKTCPMWRRLDDRFFFCPRFYARKSYQGNVGYYN